MVNGIQGISNISYYMNVQNTNKQDENKDDPFLTDAAKVLGISYDDLVSRLESGTDLDTIVTDQGMTVDGFKEQMLELNPNKGMAGKMPPPGGGGKGADQFIDDAASVLGMSTDELKSQLESGVDLQSIIEDQGMTMNDFQQEMSTLFESFNSSATLGQTGTYINTRT